MAGRLARAGFAVKAWNRSPAKGEALAKDGVVMAGSPAEAVAGAEVVVTMLSDGRALDAVLGGKKGLLAGLAPGALVIEMSTAGRAAARRA